MAGKRTLSIILDFCIILCVALSLYFLYGFMEQGMWRNITTGLVLTPIFGIILYEASCRSGKKKVKKREPYISVLTLLGEDDRPIRIWDLTGKVGLIIGKSSEEEQVDMDLSDTDYHTYIDPEHALLNYQESGWWIEDVSARNGISIIRKGQELFPGRHAPVKLEVGDVICIARYTRIAVS